MEISTKIESGPGRPARLTQAAGRFLRANGLAIALGLAAFVGLYWASTYNYLLFHSLVEGFSIVVACGVFMLAWNSRRFAQYDYLLFLGIAYLFVGGLDLVHTIAYKGMNIFRGYDADLTTCLWIASRYVEGLSLLAAPLFLRRRIRPALCVLAYAAVSSLLLTAIFSGFFPQCFVEGVGLTAFKIVSEYVISTGLIAAAVLLYVKRRYVDPRVLTLVIASISVTVLSEMSFTLFKDVYGLFNLIGHYFKLVSFYLIYKAVIETGLVRPYDLLFRDLRLRERQLEDAVSELEAFSYSVSHDLRAPLRSMDGFSQALLEDYSDKVDEQGRDYLNRVRAGAQRMGTLIEDLLKLSRIARHEMQREQVDLSALAGKIAAELKESEPSRDVAFSIQNGLVADGDERLLRVVLENLLGNAWKFTSKRAKAVIELGATEHEGQTAYFVRDNGAGFDMAYAGKLFGAFQRLHSTAEFTGTGIGLATVQRIIRRHGGRVWAEGEVGKGATFYFTL